MVPIKVFISYHIHHIGSIFPPFGTIFQKMQFPQLCFSVAGIEGSDDEALATGEQDEEISRWEQEQIRKGISIPQVGIFFWYNWHVIQEGFTRF